ncbi:MAG: DmsC/YnfH family molybdoenzyme membrane anchor subunit [Rhodovibrionaceae bacterium]
MHPAASVILFTASSGAGYGLLFLIALAAAFGLPLNSLYGAAASFLALGLISTGLLASTFHLGHPERAWRALSQWRSSWLSREGVAAVATYLPAGIFLLGWLFPLPEALWKASALLAALGAVATVICTGKIYASLKTIRQWHHPLVVPVYLLWGLATGALLAAALGPLGTATDSFGYLAAGGLAALLLVKPLYWSSLASAKPGSTAETATGLGGIGKVRPLDYAHTARNYVMEEMGYRVARKHARRLRGALLVSLCLALLLSLGATLTAGWLSGGLALLALACGLLGVALERWLFFAEAEHKVTLYYGATAA